MHSYRQTFIVLVLACIAASFAFYFNFAEAGYGLWLDLYDSNGVRTGHPHLATEHDCIDNISGIHSIKMHCDTSHSKHKHIYIAGFSSNNCAQGTCKGYWDFDGQDAQCGSQSKSTTFSPGNDGPYPSSLQALTGDEIQAVCGGTNLPG